MMTLYVLLKSNVYMGDQEKRGSNLAQRIRRQYDILVVGGIGHNSRACTNPIPR